MATNNPTMSNFNKIWEYVIYETHRFEDVVEISDAIELCDTEQKVQIYEQFDECLQHLYMSVHNIFPALEEARTKKIFYQLYDYEIYNNPDMCFEESLKNIISLNYVIINCEWEQKQQLYKLLTEFVENKDLKRFTALKECISNARSTVQANEEHNKKNEKKWDNEKRRKVYVKYTAIAVCIACFMVGAHDIYRK
jgi:hypothetical protein